jgi:hypothetical protein
MFMTPKIKWVVGMGGIARKVCLNVIAGVARNSG